MKVSVIIPILNEAAIIEESLAAIVSLNPHEIIVVDGGSRDATVLLACDKATRVINSKAGRAHQMNMGAKVATGDLLLFMHADSSLTLKSYKKMTDEMSLCKSAGGAFSLHIQSERLSLRLISVLATWRSKYLNLVYGDQAIFVRADIFKLLNGFSPLPICEDLEFFRRLSQYGKVILLKEKTHTSSRRWMNQGIFFTTLQNVIIATLFILGFPAQFLNKWYTEVR